MPLKEFDDKRSGWRFNWPERRLRMRSLYTNDPSEAKRRADLLRKGMSMSEFRRQFEGTSTKRDNLTSRMDKYRGNGTSADSTSSNHATSESVDATLAEVLDRVASARESIDDGTNNSGDSAAESYRISNDSNGPDTSIDPEDDNSVEGEEPETVEPPEEKKTRKKYGKLGRDLAHTMANINIGLDGLLAKAFGSNKKTILRPKQPPDEIMSVMYEGYELQMDEWLVDHPPRPWMLILAGNIGCIIFMAVNGERVPRESVNGTVVPPAEPVPPKGV